MVVVVGAAVVVVTAVVGRGVAVVVVGRVVVEGIDSGSSFGLTAGSGRPK